MKKRKLRNQWSYDYKKETTGEVNSGEIITKPNDTLSLKTLLEHHTRGRTIPIRQALYPQEGHSVEDEIMTEQFRNMDKADQAMVIKESNEIVKAVKKKIAVNKRKAEIEEEAEKLLKQPEQEAQEEQET